ncbi:MAG: hypothetical protein M3N24_10765 [Actinomycetota bacterium]|nr:hypothetical protein [Actinomycetota bacterium]
MTMQIAIAKVPPILRRALETELSAGGFEIHEPKDLLAWASASDRRGVVLSVESPDDLWLAHTLREARNDIAVVALIPQSLPAFYSRVLREGAVPVAHTAAVHDVVAVLREAMEGRASIPQEAARAIARGEGVDPDAEVLSGDEVEWLRRLSGGVTVSELAREAGHSKREMYRLLAAMYGRMGVHGKIEALVRAAQWGLISERHERNEGSEPAVWQDPASKTIRNDHSWREPGLLPFRRERLRSRQEVEAPFFGRRAP